MFEDQTLHCRDCAQPFVFTTGEQGFYLEKGLLNQPQRCASCREQRRHERTSLPRMTPVVCAECARETTVPFVPRLGRPVYCNDCFVRVRPSVA